LIKAIHRHCEAILLFAEAISIADRLRLLRVSPDGAKPARNDRELIKKMKIGNCQLAIGNNL